MIQTKKEKPTLASLTLESQRRGDAVERLRAEDLRIRTVLSELLGSIEYTRGLGYSTNEGRVKVQSWEGIAFLIGELKSDADYSLIVEQVKNLKDVERQLREKIYQLENPEKK